MTLNDTISRYPLHWPAGRPRTTNRQRPRFEAKSFSTARDGLLNQLKLLGARGVILSTNVELRRDGLPLASQRNPTDPGVAVYFTRKGKDLAFACDRWIAVEENMRAIADAIECIRTIERRGTGEMVDAAFTGFAALPPGPPGKHWTVILGVSGADGPDRVKEAYRSLALEHHPDRGGDSAKMQEINDAYESFKRERGVS